MVEESAPPRWLRVKSKNKSDRRPERGRTAPRIRVPRADSKTLHFVYRIRAHGATCAVSLERPATIVDIEVWLGITEDLGTGIRPYGELTAMGEPVKSR